MPLPGRCSLRVLAAVFVTLFEMQMVSGSTKLVQKNTKFCVFLHNTQKSSYYNTLKLLILFDILQGL